MVASFLQCSPYLGKISNLTDMFSVVLIRYTLPIMPLRKRIRNAAILESEAAWCRICAATKNIHPVVLWCILGGVLGYIGDEIPPSFVAFIS